jgi:SAM-dependent methyltransferase
MNKNSMEKYYKNLMSIEQKTSRKVGWRDEAAQIIRFQQLYKLIENENNPNIADLGCGLATFYGFLKEQKRNFNYTGYDISKSMIANAKKIINDNNCELLLIDNIAKIKEHDFIILSGVFNMKKEVKDNVWLDYILNQLEVINHKSRKGFGFNLLTSYSDSEFKDDELFYAEPDFFFNYCKKKFSKNVALLHDYEEYDFTVIVRK